MELIYCNGDGNNVPIVVCNGPEETEERLTPQFRESQPLIEKLGMEPITSIESPIDLVLNEDEQPSKVYQLMPDASPSRIDFYELICKFLTQPRYNDELGGDNYYCFEEKSPSFAEIYIRKEVYDNLVSTPVEELLMSLILRKWDKNLWYEDYWNHYRFNRLLTSGEKEEVAEMLNINEYKPDSIEFDDKDVTIVKWTHNSWSKPKQKVETANDCLPF